MFFPAAFTRVLDEENNRVLTACCDGRTTAGVNDAGGAVDCAVPVQDGPPQLARTQGEQWARFALPTL
jgi:hypothetical protein